LLIIHCTHTGRCGDVMKCLLNSFLFFVQVRLEAEKVQMKKEWVPRVELDATKKTLDELEGRLMSSEAQKLDVEESYKVQAGHFFWPTLSVNKSCLFSRKMFLTDRKNIWLGDILLFLIPFRV